MKITLLILSFFTLTSLSIDKNNFYDVLSGGSYQKISELITKIDQQESTSIKKAYKGALLTKKADLENSISKKVKTFKNGMQLLESEIKKFPKQIEYRFLRLCIQENCPKILRYNKNITDDVQLITHNFSKQSEQLKAILLSTQKTLKH